MRLLIYDTERETANGYLPRAISKAAQNSLGKSNVRLADHKDVVQLAASDQWDGLLAIGGAGADPHLLTALMRTGIPRVLWTTEDPYERRLIEQAEHAFHHVFTNDCKCDCASQKTSFLPLAAEPTVHFRPVREHENAYRYDLTFVGTAWPNRMASLQKLLANLPVGLNINLTLPWNRHIPEPRLEQFHVIPRQRLAIHDLCDIWNESRVVLTIGREFSAGSQRAQEMIGSSPPPRVYETALAGGFQVALQNASMELNSAYGQMIPIAVNEDDAASLIMQYLRDGQRRIQAAKEIQTHTLKHHTYEQRLDVVFEILTSIGNQFRARRSPPAPLRCAGVLHVAHNLVGLGLRQPGGTEAYVDALAREQHRRQPDRPIFAIAPMDPDHLGLLDYSSGRPQLKHSIRVGKVHSLAASQLHYERALARVIDQEGISIVHIHHLIGWPLGLPLVAKSLGCKVVITAHDYYLACHRYNLLMPDGRFCAIYDAPNPQIRCNACLREAGLSGTERTKRLAVVRKVLEAADVVLASTMSSATILSEIFPGLARKIKLIEMLTPRLDELKAIARPDGFQQTASASSKLRVGLIGNQVPHKGFDTIKKILVSAPALPIEWRILGSMPKFESSLKSVGINQSSPAILQWQGAYNRDDLIKVLNNIDVALFLSTWPETYNISLGEAMSQGVIPIATSIGAHRDRVHDLMNGLLVPPDDSEAVIEAMLKLHTDPCLMSRLKMGALQSSLVSSSAHVDQLEEVYGHYGEGQNAFSGSEPPIPLPEQIDLRMLGIRLPHKTFDSTSVSWDTAI